MSAELEKTRQESDGLGNELERLVELVPKDKKKQAHEIVAVVKESMFAFSGPIPPPEQFEQYERILPGSADRILKMAEKQQDHRMEIEKEAVTKSLNHNKRGQTFGFIAMILLLGLAVFFAIIGMKSWAGIIGSITMVTLVTLFVTGSVKNEKDLKSKR